CRVSVDDRGSIVVRIVQYLDQQAVAWVCDVAHGAEQTFDDVAFVVHRQLDCNAGQPVRRTGQVGGGLFRAWMEPIDQRQNETVNTVSSQDEQANSIQPFQHS